MMFFWHKFVRHWILPYIKSVAKSLTLGGAVVFQVKSKLSSFSQPYDLSSLYTLNVSRFLEPRQKGDNLLSGLETRTMPPVMPRTVTSSAFLAVTAVALRL